MQQKKCLSVLQKKDFTYKEHIAKFNNDSGEIAKSILMKILECSLLGSVIVKHVGVFVPKKLYNDD